MQLNEKVFNYSIDKQTEGLREGILARVKYILNDIDKPNFNKRVYERATIEKAISDKDIQEKLTNRNLWVGPEHPTSSMLPATDIAGILTEMYIDEEKNQLIGVVEVLGTPAGKIIEAILKGGGGIGVSTRAEGELMESEMEFEGKKGKYFRVVKESYKLNGLDFTSEPSCFSSKVPLDKQIAVFNDIKSGVAEHKIERAMAITLLETMDNKESKDLVEHILKAKEHNCKNGACIGCGCHGVKEAVVGAIVKGGEVKKPTEKEQEQYWKDHAEFYAKEEELAKDKKNESIQPNDIVKVNEQMAVVNQIFEKTGKCIVQIGTERKTVSLSECKKVSIQEDITNPFDATDNRIQAQGHKPENVILIYFYNKATGELRVEKDKNSSHVSSSIGYDIDKEFKDKADDLWVHGRVFSYDRKNYLSIYWPETKHQLSSLILNDILNKCQEAAGVQINRVVDSNGDDISELFEHYNRKLEHSYNKRWEKEVIEYISESGKKYNLEIIPNNKAVLLEGSPVMFKGSMALLFRNDLLEGKSELIRRDDLIAENDVKVSSEEKTSSDPEAIYAEAIKLVPELAKFDKNEVEKGLNDEKEHKDVIAKFAPSNEVEFLAMVVAAHLKEKPNYYAILDAGQELEGKNKELDAQITHEKEESAAKEKEEHAKEVKSKVTEAILREEKLDAIEHLTEAFNNLENTYIQDICDLTERLEAKKVNEHEIKALQNSNIHLEQIAEGFKRELKETQDRLNMANKTVAEQIEAIVEANKQLKEQETLIDEAVKQIIDIKEAHEVELKETRINCIAEAMGVTISNASMTELKECKTNTEVIKHIQEQRNNLAKALIHEGVKESVSIVTLPKIEKSAMRRMVEKIHG